MVNEFSSLSNLDTQDARWVSREIDGLLQRVAPDSIVSLMLKQTRMELNSLMPMAHSQSEQETPTLKIAA